MVSETNELTNAACPKCGAVIDPETETYAIRIYDCGSRVHRGGYVVSQSDACEIAELQHDLATAKVELDDLARKASDDERVVEAAEELISVTGGNCFDSGYAPRKHAAWAVLKRTVADYRTQRGG